MIEIHIADHLLIPFGAKKYDIKTIQLAGVSTSGTYFTSPIPVAHIDRRSKSALRLRHMNSCFLEDFNARHEDDCISTAKEYLLKVCDERASVERKFVDLYFEFVLDKITKKYDFQTGPPYDDKGWFWDALLPLPQAHLYVNDPLTDDTFVFVPKHMFKVDFAFWTGHQVLAVEIDGGSHYTERRPGGDATDDHIIRDRMLQRASVRVIHILNEELLKHPDIIARLLPSPITEFWKNPDDNYRESPFCPF